MFAVNWLASAICLNFGSFTEMGDLFDSANVSCEIPQVPYVPLVLLRSLASVTALLNSHAFQLCKLVLLSVASLRDAGLSVWVN